MAEGGKHELAEKSLKEVIKYPAPANDAWAYGLYRHALYLVALGRPGEAQSELEQVVRDCAATPSLCPFGGLEELARREAAGLGAGR